MSFREYELFEPQNTSLLSFLQNFANIYTWIPPCPISCWFLSFHTLSFSIMAFHVYCRKTFFVFKPDPWQPLFNSLLCCGGISVHWTSTKQPSAVSFQPFCESGWLRHRIFVSAANFGYMMSSFKWWGNVPFVGGSFAPSRFLLLNSSHLNWAMDFFSFSCHLSLE